DEGGPRYRAEHPDRATGGHGGGESGARAVRERPGEHHGGRRGATAARAGGGGRCRGAAERVARLAGGGTGTRRSRAVPGTGSTIRSCRRTTKDERPTTNDRGDTSCG